MSNSHTSANCVVVSALNGIPFPLTKPLHYKNSFSFENITVARKLLPFFSKTASRVGSNGWRLVINGSYNNFYWKAQWKRVQWSLPFH